MKGEVFMLEMNLRQTSRCSCPIPATLVHTCKGFQLIEPTGLPLSPTLNLRNYMT